MVCDLTLTLTSEQNKLATDTKNKIIKNINSNNS